jgi:hypothetical protein
MTASKKIIIGTVFALVLMVGAGSTLGTSAQAQWGGRRVVVVPRYGFYPHRWGGWWGYPYPAYGYYGYPYYYTPRYDAGPYDVAKGKGYHDGFDRGQEDARKGNRFDPNNSSHFRNSISTGYRDGFREGYANGYNHRTG